MARLTTLSRSVAGKTVIVTGAASGMGRATAHLFADEGAHVVVADIGAERVGVVVDEIRTAHGADRVLGVPTDVTADTDRRALVAATVERFGDIDVLVNNAGISRASSVFADDEAFAEAWNATLAVNLSAYAHLVRLVVPHMQGRGGRIVNVASTEAIVATPGLAAYSAAKHGVVGLTKSLAAELGRHGINVNAICPGPINTAMTAAIPTDSKAIYAKRKVPLRRYGEPEEVAQMTLSACLPAASFLNGASIVVDGGMTILH
ncbi:MAG: SDR family oxidoreductase [Acidobacteria bacterium]|nr:SDR family oxidoreductase [Acidobacteriota bacterium]